MNARSLFGIYHQSESHRRDCRAVICLPFLIILLIGNLSIGTEAVGPMGYSSNSPIVVPSRAKNPIDNRAVTVHYFGPAIQGVHVGHVSMTLPDGTYISWFPEQRRLVSPVVRHRTMGDDIAAEGMNPIDFKIENVDTKEVKAWWEQFSNTHNYWMAQGPNCTTVVGDALRAGGIQEVPSSKQAWYPRALLPTLESLSGKVST